MNEKTKKDLEKLHKMFEENLPNPQHLNPQQLISMQLEILQMEISMLSSNTTTLKELLIKNKVINNKEFNLALKKTMLRKQANTEFVSKLKQGV